MHDIASMVCRIKSLAAGLSLFFVFAASSSGQGAVATGGNVITTGLYTVHTFIDSGTFTVNVPNLKIDVLVVAGGGGGGGGAMGGGGGGGGVVQQNDIAVTPGDHTVVVGAGGLGGYAYNLPSQAGLNGNNSSFDDIVAIGGGGGAGWVWNQPGAEATSGGSGGGGNDSTPAKPGTPGQGYAGGASVSSGSSRTGGGGGGGGAPGQQGATSVPGKGGDGYATDISGVSTYYAGGGGGGLESAILQSDGGGAGGQGGGGSGSKGSIKAIDAIPNTGGGGGGAGYTGAATGRLGGNGGAGIVIVRYMLLINSLPGATNVTQTSAWLTGELFTGDGVESVTAYWGTTDGGSNADAWEHAHQLDAIPPQGPFSWQATGLTGNTTYYYRYAVRINGHVFWSPASGCFITAEVTLFGTQDGDEANLEPCVFTVKRPLSMTNIPLTLFYKQSGGTAVAGADFEPLPGRITMPEGAASVAIRAIPIKNYGRQEDATLKLSLLPINSSLGDPSSAQLIIKDSGFVVNKWIRSGSDPKASVPANWSLGHAPLANEIVLLTNSAPLPDMTWDVTTPVGDWLQKAEYRGTVTVATTFPIDGFPIFQVRGSVDLQGGVWTHTANPAGEIEHNRLAVKIGGNMTVGAAASINVDDKGFAAGMYGPGKGGGENYDGYGASHGGWDAEQQSRGPYGSIVAPTNLGSSCAARAGGGAVLLEVARVATINGAITARGAHPTTPSGYNAGAGGSIFIKTGALLGGGTIDAKGGNGYYGGSGGGGRIALVVTNAFSFGSIDVRAGGGTNGPGNYNNYDASAGTVYKEHAGHQPGKGILTIANYFYADPYMMRKWPVTDMPTGTAANAAVNLDNFSKIALSNGTLGIRQDTLMTNWDLSRFETYGPELSFIAVRGTNALKFPSVMLIDNYSLHLDVPVSASGNWSILSNGNLSHSYDSRLELFLDGNLAVQPGGFISAHRRGYLPGPAPGTGGYGSGASHGGRGGVGYADTPMVYGSAFAPITSGSQNNMRGGGAIKINLTGTLAANGYIDANADMRKLPNEHYGSGSGGSIWITAGAFVGTCAVHALGGHGVISPGGGGRISLIETNGAGVYALSCSAQGGRTSGFRYAAPGTVYRQTSGDLNGWGVLTVNNSNALPDLVSLTDLPAQNMGDAPEAFKRVTLRIESGRVAICTNLTLGDLYLTTTNALLLLNGYSLWVRARYHEDWGSTNQVLYRGGSIFWGSPGSMLSVE